MEALLSALEKLKNINSSYDLPTEDIENLKTEIAKAKVCIPIIGKFSSGKSALLNTLLGYGKKLLKEDITPETAIPAEIEFSEAEDRAIVFCNDGSEKQLDIEAYRSFTADANKVQKVRLQLRSSFLETIPDVMLVDMPGFESGFAIHNKAIDDYLPQSLAYIVAFPADDLIVRDSVGRILQELCLNGMPICVAVTKYDKSNPHEYAYALASLKEKLKKYIGSAAVSYCETSSFTKETEELKKYLRDIQAQSREILTGKFRRLALPLFDAAQNYLKTNLNSIKLSESELSEQEDKLRKQMSRLESSFAKAKAELEAEISDCADNIKNDVRQALNNEEAAFISMALSGQDIGSQLNAAVRNAVTVSWQKHFIPKVKKYERKTSQILHAEPFDGLQLSFTFASAHQSRDLMTTAGTGAAEKAAEGAALLKAVGSGLGWGSLLGAAGSGMGLESILGSAGSGAGLGAILGPVGTFIGGIAGSLIGGFISLFQGGHKREEAKQQIRQQLRAGVFPQVVSEVGHKTEEALVKQLALINTSIAEDLKRQRDTLNKAMADLRGRMHEEKERQERLTADMQADLERINEITDGWR
ncbi:MAG: dynamin family protein [bacterium]|nr:dynamin family protein [bacterium]